MSNPQKRKGDQAERDLVAWLNAHGYPHARRTRAGWNDDMGDINLGAPTLIEVKNRQQLSISTWLKELAAKFDRFRGFDDAVLIVKRPGQSDPGDWWAIRRVRDEFGPYRSAQSPKLPGRAERDLFGDRYEGPRIESVFER